MTSEVVAGSTTRELTVRVFFIIHLELFILRFISAIS